ncbi:cytochrome P450 [Rhizohabitans arisaemae]|uniref:cytochrome P450 n=1 Tax=Rhizohabitans arisaemae TaxID=2720610 RepID=UPI0024B205FA|nr:cytochrome P450 [Rhizohabitans arisaemae]
MTPTARRHERRLIRAGNPSLAALLTLARVTGPIRKIPRVGWVVNDPVVARRILNDYDHFTMVGEGGVGHLWGQLFGPAFAAFFGGQGHADLRVKARDMFTEVKSTALVDRVLTPMLSDVRRNLAEGDRVDVVRTAKLMTGRVVADVLGLELRDRDEAYLRLFVSGERLAALALGTQVSTVLAPETIEQARSVVREITGGVEEAYRTRGAETILGRSREIGLDVEIAKALATLVTIAGTETAASAMARTVALLADTGQTAALLADRSRIPDAVREGLRVTSAAPVLGRHVAKDVVVQGRRLRAGDRILLAVHTANNRPGGFDVTRPYLPETRQLWFGAGRHLCLGAALGRAQLTRLLETLTAAGRPWRIESRTPARKVLVPTYATLTIRMAE